MALFISIFFCSCIEKGKHFNTPEKAKGIPENAFWAGGMDGGNWYLIDSSKKSRKEATIRVFNDQNGDQIISKTFRMECINEDGIDWNNLKSQIVSFDGEKILLEIKGSGSVRRYCYFE